ncbi:MAG: class I SAM-dependent methyltransferase [Actinobacteria bacterium]|nr:class I SAM-dependent methyltransferase [Actinomycetota bacterium]
MTGVNQAQQDAWNGESGHRWAADADRRDAVLAPVADALLAAAGLQPGETVLDLGCGCGATTLAAAELVAPANVLGLDLSGPMLELARQRTGTRAATFVRADAQTHAFDGERFDVAIGRFGTMFFDDPVAAFTNIATAMRPGGRLCLATWQALDANDWLLVPGAVLLQHGQLPEAATTAGPGMFAQADADRVRAVLISAGWSDIEVAPANLQLRLGATPAEALSYLADTGIARAVLDTIDPALRTVALEQVEATLAEHRSADGVELGCAINLIHARA